MCSTIALLIFLGLLHSPNLLVLTLTCCVCCINNYEEFAVVLFQCCFISRVNVAVKWAKLRNVS